jgi:RHS repeat-associated protein
LKPWCKGEKVRDKTGTGIWEVYFDDFTVQQIKSPVVETTDYYNAGAISSTYSRESIVPNKFKYQHKEYQDDLGLNLYDFEARQYDPWTQLTTTHDPHAESYYEWSPYIWEHDNAVRYADPTGMDPQGPGDPKPRTVNDLNPAERVVLAISLVFDKIGQVLNERNGNDNPTTNQNIVAATNFVGEVVMAGQAHMEMMQPSGGSKVASKVDDAAGQTKTVASETSSLGARAKEIHGAVSKATQGRTTIAVGEARNSEGQVVRIVGSSENRLRPAQRAMLRSNEIEATGAGHAEATVLRFAGQVDLKVGNIAASRPICQGCATAINGAGATAVTPLKKPVITTTQ